MRKIKSKESMLKTENAITLIALIITIIVLLILAGVTIATLTGKNGILTRASEAKENTEQAEEDELRKLTQAEASTYLEEHEYTDVSGEKITIPAKCAVSQVEGENTLEDGLVIIDVNGNEWVWIEVPESVMPEGLTFTNETDYETLETALQTYATNYRGSYTDEWYEGCGLEEEEYTQLKQKMLKSIYENEGFYVGRYEVGIQDDKNRSFDNGLDVEYPINERPVIQRDRYVYNWVRCSQAQKLSETLSIGNKTSSLMFGIQRELLLKYLEINEDWDMSDASYYLKTDSSSWGNYTNTSFDVLRGAYSTDNGISFITISNNYMKKDGNCLLTTGATDRNCKMNIYDLAGNVWEWILAKSNILDEYKCTVIGAGYSQNGASSPVYAYGYRTITISYVDMGFRTVLY